MCRSRRPGRRFQYDDTILTARGLRPRKGATVDTGRLAATALPQAEIHRRVDDTDLPNGDVVGSESLTADVVLSQCQIGRI